jgi:peptidoglycan/LPS O-acetylase OafA/YrhL
MAKTATGRLPSLDGLRALSILLVLLAHATHTAQFPEFPGRTALNEQGTTGVLVFFVISGFLITSLLLGEEDKKDRVSLKHFYLRRSVRILPVYGCLVLVVFLLDCWHDWAVRPANYWQALTYTTGFFDLDSWVLSHTWSLAVEEHFYLLWPLAFVLLPTRLRFHLAWAVVLFGPLLRAVAHRMGWFILGNFSFLGRGDAIMWGCLAALYVRHFPLRVQQALTYRPFAGRWLALGVIAGVSIANHVDLLPRLRIPLGVSATAIAATYLICSYTRVESGWDFQALNHPVLVSLGVLSYSLYIWQQVFLFPRSSQPLWWQSFPQNLVLVGIVAYVSYRCIETPFLRLKQRLRW